jgi:hypothetical protein
LAGVALVVAAGGLVAMDAVVSEAVEVLVAMAAVVAATVEVQGLVWEAMGQGVTLLPPLPTHSVTTSQVEASQATQSLPAM